MFLRKGLQNKVRTSTDREIPKYFRSSLTNGQTKIDATVVDFIPLWKIERPPYVLGIKMANETSTTGEHAAGVLIGFANSMQEPFRVRFLSLFISAAQLS